VRFTILSGANSKADQLMAWLWHHSKSAQHRSGSRCSIEDRYCSTMNRTLHYCSVKPLEVSISVGREEFI